MPKIKIVDRQCGGYFAGGEVFESIQDVIDQLISYHSIDSEDEMEWAKKIRLQANCLNELLDYGEWEIEYECDHCHNKLDYCGFINHNCQFKP